MNGLQDFKEWQESAEWLEERQGMKYDNNKDKGWMESDSVVFGDWLIIDIVNFVIIANFWQLQCSQSLYKMLIC